MSDGRISSMSMTPRAYSKAWPCVTITPFDGPVVPEVYMMAARSHGARGCGMYSSVWSKACVNDGGLLRRAIYDDGGERAQLAGDGVDARQKFGISDHHARMRVIEDVAK